MEKGKSFESQTARWFKKEGYYFERFFDSRSVGQLTSIRPSDFFVYHHKQLFYIECKSTIYNSMHIKCFHQIPRLLAKEKYGIITYFFIKFNNKNIIAIKTQDLYNAIKTDNLKSVTIEKLKNYNIIELPKSNNLTEVFGNGKES